MESSDPRTTSILTLAMERLLSRVAGDALARLIGADQMLLTADGAERGAGPSQPESALLS